MQEEQKAPTYHELLIRSLDDGFFVSWYDPRSGESIQKGCSTFEDVQQEIEVFKRLTGSR